MAIYDVSTNEKKASPSLVAGGTLYADSPVGTILPFGGLDDKIPSGWLKCNGQEVSRTTYAELFTVIGTAFGSGDGTSTFNVPDMRETVPVGYGLNDGNSSITDHDSYAIGEFKDDQLQSDAYQGRLVGSVNAVSWGGTNSNPSIYLSTFNARTGTTTHGKQLGVNYIIKAKMVALPADLASGVEEICSGKADKVSNATNGDIASLDANGNLVDSGASKNVIGAKANMTLLTNEDLNNISTEGWYYTSGTDSVTNKPYSGLNNNVIHVFYQGSTERYAQVLFSMNSKYYYTRRHDANGWSSWEKLVTESDINTVTAGTATNTANVTSGACTWVKKGSVVVVTLNSFKPVTYTGGDRQLATGLPKPIAYTAWGLNSVDGSKKQLFSIGTNGILMGASGSMQGGVAYYQTMTYLTND